MPKVFTSETQKTGEIGENIACKFLMKHGFSVLDRNYTKKWGEIDIVAEKQNKLYFIEVKSVSRQFVGQARETLPLNVPHETNKSTSPRLQKLCFKHCGQAQPSPYQGEGKMHDSYRPEDNMHPWKLKRLSRAIQTYLLQKKITDEKEWQVDLLVVYLDLKAKKARIKVVKDIVL